jgi:hypothetical protein
MANLAAQSCQRKMSRINCANAANGGVRAHLRIARKILDGGGRLASN